MCLQTEDVVVDLATDQGSADTSGWLWFFWNRVLQRDIFAVVSRSERLMRIHTTAEQFDPVTDCIFGAIQASAMVHDCMMVEACAVSLNPA